MKLDPVDVSYKLEIVKRIPTDISDDFKTNPKTYAMSTPLSSSNYYSHSQAQPVHTSNFR